MEIHWKDRYNQAEDWQGLAITVTNTPKENYRLQAGGRNRLKLSNAEHTIFWATIEHDYYGVWLLSNHAFFNKYGCFINPISSALINYTMEEPEYAGYWARFFMESLQNSNSCFLNDGTWELSLSDMRQPDRKLPAWKISNLPKTYQQTQPAYIDNGASGSFTIIPLKPQPQISEGRLQWWRKKVREGTCPPILTWYINSLKAFVLIDGHYRLQASLMENRTPAIMVLTEVLTTQETLDKSVQESVLRNIEARQNQSIKKKMSVEEINNLLIRIFDDRPDLRPITKSLGKYDFEKIWVKEVLEVATHIAVDEEALEVMIKNWY